jgi:hypothetical protein
MSDRVDDAKLAEARTRIAGLANNLALAFGPATAGELLLGASVGLIEGALGSEKAAEYLQGLADEIRANEGLPPLNIGHA